MFNLTLGRADCGHFDCATQKEWLVTNGLGGYASGTVSGTTPAVTMVCWWQRCAPLGADGDGCQN